MKPINHTAAPWHRSGGSIFDARGNLIASRYSWRHPDRAEGYGDIEPSEADANCRLMSASPELYEACVSALEALRDMHMFMAPEVVKHLEESERKLERAILEAAAAAAAEKESVVCLTCNGKGYTPAPTIAEGFGGYICDACQGTGRVAP